MDANVSSSLIEGNQWIEHPSLVPCRVSGQTAVNGWHFVRDHNPVWAARVFGSGVKRATLAVPRPNWHRGRPTLTRHASAVSVHMRNAWKRRPPLPRPHYRLRERPVKSVHMNYVDVALFYIIAVKPPPPLPPSLSFTTVQIV